MFEIQCLEDWSVCSFPELLVSRETIEIAGCGVV